MTEVEDCKRVARVMFSTVKEVNFSNAKSEAEKVEETERRLNDLDKKHELIIKMLNQRIMFGLISESERNRMLDDIAEIKNEYLN